MPKGLTLSWRMVPPAFHPHKPPQYSGHLLKEKPKNQLYCAFGSMIALISFERDFKQKTQAKQVEPLFPLNHL